MTAFVLTAIASGLLLLGVFIGWPWLLSNIYTSNEKAQNTTIWGAVRDLYQSQGGNYGAGDITALLVQQGTLTSTVNSFGGSITVTGNGSTFFVDRDNIPTGPCISLMTSAAAGSGILQVGAAAAGTTPGSLMSVGMSPVDAGAACSSSTNKMRFVMQ